MNSLFYVELCKKSQFCYWVASLHPIGQNGSYWLNFPFSFLECVMLFSRLGFILSLLFCVGMFACFSQSPVDLNAEEKKTATVVKEEGFRSIFDGKTLEGWKGDTKFWRVENGTLVGESTKENPCKENTFLLWTGGKVADFELRLKFKITGDASANSGIQFRSKQEEDGHVVGYQADLDRGGKWIGMCYDEKGRGTLCKRGERVVMTADGKREAKSTHQSQKILKSINYDDWNEYTIRAVGNHLTLSLNGKECADIIDNDEKNRDFSGVLALQLHSGPPMKIAFKEIRLKTIPVKKRMKASKVEKPTADTGTHSHRAGDAVSKLDVYPGLEATLFASEPMMFSPSSMDIDHLGRIWICEIVNYRNKFNKDKPTRPEGDRILVLEDTDGDGKADKTTTFYQGTDIDGAHGVHCYGDKIFVSTSNTIFQFTDADGDLKPEEKKVLFTAYEPGKQHDHALHAVTIGPDGKMYFSFGNVGKKLMDKDGNVLTDKRGNKITDEGKPYRQGMAFRCDIDGTNVETLAWNFRNNWELAVDSFGNIWQSDNDDDGNLGVRINFVMKGGNYGYTDELTGAGWKTQRTGQSKVLQEREWHQNDPGVVPNLINTGSGSPTGICIYEGTLLPEIFQNEILHCDAGPNIVRCFPVSKKGAGYTAKSVTLVDGRRDNWFRPTSVRVAPDGSVFIADWYDPGVGGHRMGDTLHGRIFRIAPPGHKYRFVKPDFSTVDGAIAALQSPNVATRNLGAQSLFKMGWKAIPELVQFEGTAKSPRMRARALWVLSALRDWSYRQMDAQKLAPGFDLKQLNLLRDLFGQALFDSAEEIQIVAIRASGSYQFNPRVVSSMLQVMDRATSLSPAVMREIMLKMNSPRSRTTPEHFAKAWALLAEQHKGKDRWFLETLGILADGQWDMCLSAWIELRKSKPARKDFLGKQGKQMQRERLWKQRSVRMRTSDWEADQAYRDIVWRSRGSETPKLLMENHSSGYRH